MFSNIFNVSILRKLFDGLKSSKSESSFIQKIFRLKIALQIYLEVSGPVYSSSNQFSIDWKSDQITIKLSIKTARLLTADFLTSPQFKLNSLKLGSHFLSTSLIIRGQNYIISIRDQANKFLNACHSRLNGSIMQLSEQQMASRFLQSMGKTSVKKFCRC